MKFSVSTIIAAGTIILSTSTANAADYWQGEGHETGYGSVEVMPNGNLAAGNVQVTPDGYAVSDTGAGVLKRKIDTDSVHRSNGGVAVSNPYSNVRMGGGHLDVSGGSAKADIIGGAAGGVVTAIGGIQSGYEGADSARDGADSARDSLAGIGVYPSGNRVMDANDYADEADRQADEEDRIGDIGDSIGGIADSLSD
jgi:hypothetical protein